MSDGRMADTERPTAPEIEPRGVDRSPAVAHIAPDDPFTALCGAKLLGIDAPVTAPICQECWDLWKQREDEGEDEAPVEFDPPSICSVAAGDLLLRRFRAHQKGKAHIWTERSVCGRYRRWRSSGHGAWMVGPRLAAMTGPPPVPKEVAFAALDWVDRRTLTEFRAARDAAGRG